MSQQFRFSTDAEGIAEIVIDKPPVNALDSEGWLSLAACIRALGTDPKTRVIVIRAEGRGFCAGQDLGQRKGGEMPDLSETLDKTYNKLIRAIREADGSSCTALSASTSPLSRSGPRCA